VLFAGGGSGGHVFPALAVAEELAGRGWTVVFAGTAGGMEEGLVGGRGWPFAALPARPLVGRNPVAQARALVTVGRSTLAARRLIRRRGVDAVVGTGGYVSAPAVLGARLAGRPALLVEPNAEPGVANRWLSRWAAGAAVAYAETGARLHCPSWVTGIPVRREFFAVGNRAEGGGGPRLLVLGGSQGARQLNRDLPAALARIAGGLPGLSVFHQTGRGQEEATRGAYAAAGLAVTAPGDAPAPDSADVPGAPSAVSIEVAEFIDGVAEAMAEADLVASRAGAITAAELCAAGRAALLVPLALAGGHQSGNALLLAEAGAAVVVPADAGAERLAAALGDLLGDPGRLAAMGRAARALARAGAAAAIADRVEALAGRRTGGAPGGGAGAGAEGDGVDAGAAGAGAPGGGTGSDWAAGEEARS
jgi:UDP-N-acetylglucosamine--N-acetylmuramyl-(pentapeptide) pyrophosphoryl-undecaprenol N-acetylglucosamine transferase